jgi:adenosylmethionine---8-amino-7-oxononanoate aminotransferase
LMCLGKVFCPLFPMAAVLATDRVFSAFDGGKDRAFLHGHTFCGNPLGAAVALEVLAIYREERVLEQVSRKARVIQAAFSRLAEIPGVERVRSIGMVGAADLAEPGGPRRPAGGGAGGGDPYLGEVGWRVYGEAKKRGAYLRPLGSTVYVCPPLTIPDKDLGELLSILDASVQASIRT